MRHLSEFEIRDDVLGSLIRFTSSTRHERNVEVRAAGTSIAVGDGMSLEQYCHPKRTVILNPRANAYEAARALEHNHIGAIVVQDAGKVVGIVTDRDLVLRVIGFDIDAKQALLDELMTPEPATVSIDDSELEALELMRDRHVRRIPIVDAHGAAKGIVTLDDLILSGILDMGIAAAVVEAQLDESAPGKPAGVPYPIRPAAAAGSARHEARHASRAQRTLQQFTVRVEERLGLGDKERTLAAVEVVVSAIARRLTPREAQHFASQLPSTLCEKLLDLPAGPDASVTRAAIDAEMARRLDLDLPRAAELVRSVGASLAEHVSSGEISDVIGQLPGEMKEILTPAS